jgi:hypothetical protein
VAPPAALPSSPPDQVASTLSPALPRSHGAVSEVNRLTGELARQLREGHQLLTWCGENGRTGKPAASCRNLGATAAKASVYLAASPGRLKVEELRGTLKRLTAQMGAISALADPAPPIEAKRPSPEDVRAALLRYVHQLPAGFAQHTVPAVIPWHGSEAAVLSVGNVSPDEAKVLPKLSARLTVLDGDAIKIVKRPAQSLADGPFKWEWTLAGAHAGRAEVRMELFIEPSVDGRDGLTPLHYATWEDDITVQSSMLGDIQEAMVGTGDWLFGGATQSIRTLLILAGAGSLLLTGLWMWRRPPAELRALFLRERRGE